MKCPICGDEYDTGPKADVSFDYYPQAERFYWQHCREPHHQQVVEAQYTDAKEMLEQIPVILRKKANERARLARKIKKEQATSG